MLKKNFFYAACLLLLGGCKAGKEVYMFTSFREPANEGLRLLYSKDAYHWKELNGVFLKPEVGSKIMRDPSIAQGPDGTYHLVWTSAWRGDNGFGYASSKDLVHWSEQQFIPVMKNEKDVVNVWAPELFYDDAQKQFVIVWASTIPFRFPKGVEEENNNHRLYYTTTKDFKIFSDTKLFFDPGFSAIDAVIVKEKKDQYIQVLKDNTRPNRNLKVAFANNALGPYSSASQPFTGNFIEGPSVVKKGDEWLIYFDVYQEKIYGAMKTKDFKTFTDITKEVSVPEGHKHGTIFMAKEKLVKQLEKRRK
ncbi:glycoside hydrolase family 43 protein [Chitinophagaceae bacterium LB-8]|uniref:Glycoside hydrolase family 43 protein n=1 Tax=Paraflavisolibacter caeni TaxID=2982496 RepID=A0A9X3B9X7_9BACT|nr:glycoside hydrolase family 43 protein [Paraflavisolibacter caeni]MCU7551901.1 glycoside hydrolase family 43 protein [Paraflavisolibacter caeni]